MWAVGFVFVGQEKYLFDDEGIMQTGWHDIDGKRYYFHTGTGKMWKGIGRFGKERYVMSEEDGHLMYTDKDGKLY